MNNIATMVTAILYLLLALPWQPSTPKAITDIPKVFVCQGPIAYAYHYYPDCNGLDKCEYAVIEEPEDSAKQYRKLCKLCKRRNK